ncbi:hypothetical protein [Leisingera sp. ANG-M1]|uniref:hypothetical protein n=1 Tax=Leisingera sp. ANG-M1 TaxID=1577895 RepID=UPI00126A404D|nr:hypothetical protein [Leisingera sp. ANG-M1]
MSYTSEQLINKIGRENISLRIGVGLTAISNAVVRGKMPSSWYEGVKKECDLQGIECPTTLFSFKRPPKPKPRKQVRRQ